MTAPDQYQASALTLPRTAAALARYGLRVRRLFVGSALTAVMAWVSALTGWAFPGGTVPGAAGLALALLALGCGAFRVAGRMGRVLDTGAWRACAAVAVPHGVHVATVVLVEPNGKGSGHGRIRGGEQWPMKVCATRWRYRLAMPREPDGVLWFCGDPARGGVASLPGGDELVWLAPVVDGRARWRALHAAEDRRLADRPRPVQPRGQKARRPAAVRETARPLRAPGKSLYRWLLALSVVLTVSGAGLVGAAEAGADAAWDKAWESRWSLMEKDPEVDLEVLHKAHTGQCWARWTDPWTGRPGTSAYECGPDPDPLAHDWLTTGTTGNLVASGERRGTLYYSRGGELFNEPYELPDDVGRMSNTAMATAVVLTLGGLGLGGFSLLRGTGKHVTGARRRQAGREPHGVAG